MEAVAAQDRVNEPFSTNIQPTHEYRVNSQEKEIEK
jgi:hypothetical protein